MKIRHKITVAGIVAALVPVIAAICIIVWQVVVSDNRKAFQIVHGYITTITRGISSFFDDAKEAAIFLSSLQGASQFEWDTAGSVFNQLASSSANISKIALVDLQGHMFETGVRATLGRAA